MLHGLLERRGRVFLKEIETEPYKHGASEKLDDVLVAFYEFLDE